MGWLQHQNPSRSIFVVDPDSSSYQFEAKKMTLTPKQKSHLRSLAHKLKPVVMIGNAGVTENIIREIDNNLSHHELIKVRISGMERDDRTKTADRLSQETNSELINVIGHIAVLYRAGKKPIINLPD